LIKTGIILTETITQIKIEKGVLDLLFKQLKSGHWAVLPLAIFFLYLLRENIQTVAMLTWGMLFFAYLVISDFLILRPYGYRWTNANDNKKWFFLLALHNFIFSCFIASLSILCTLHINQLLIDLIAIIVCCVILGGCSLLAAHIASCIAWSLPLIIGLYIFIDYQNNPQLHILTVFSVCTFIIGVLFALNSRRFVYSSVETSLKNKELVEQLKVKQQLADQAAKDKSRFFASASHDLRQPLHALGLFVETLGEKTKDDEDKALIKNINQATSALQELFNALLDISRLDAGAVGVNKENFLVNDILLQINSEYQTLANKKGIQLNTQKSNVAIYSDKILTERILRNLIGNAVKYTNEGSVDINVKKESDKVYIEIIDTGIGIPNEEQKNIFSEFYQINNPERDRSKGLGLGLAIVKRLTDLLSLELTVENNQTRGTKFIIGFPAGNAEKISQEMTETKNVLNSFDGLHALVIDDEKDILEGMNIILSKWGFNVALTDSIETATDQIEEGEIPDIILSDFRLRHNTTGIETIEKIRALTKSNIPALLISGDTDPERIQEAQAAGIILLHKPIKPALLKSAINNLLSINI
jgi:signal transduction histidine kinase/CheY-like chemotaxis protein